MAKNGYHDIADAIIKEHQAGKDANANTANAGANAASHAMDQIDPEMLGQMSSQEIQQATGLEIPPPVAEQFDAAPPEQRVEMINSILGEQLGQGSAPQAFSAKDFAKQRLDAWNSGKDHEGSEVSFDNETLDMLLDQLDGEGVNALPAKDMMQILLRGDPSQDEADFYNNLGPEEKMQLLEQIIDSDGLGSIKDFMKKQ